MKNFSHIDVKTVEDCVSSIKATAKVVAGGTDLLGVMMDEILPTYPETLVNIKSIPGLDYIKEEGGILKIGTLTRLADIAENTTVTSKYKTLAKAALGVATPQIREMATIGGNLCQAVRCWYYRNPYNRFHCLRKGGAICYAVKGDNRYNAIIGAKKCFSVCPSDIAIALMALNATIVTNTRSIPIGNFYQVLGNVLNYNEIITEIQIPTPVCGTKQIFMKFAIRKSIDFAIVSLASAIVMSGTTVSSSKIMLGAVGPLPYEAIGAEDVIKGRTISDALATTAATAAVKDAISLSNNKYKIQIAITLVKRAILIGGF